MRIHMTCKQEILQPEGMVGFSVFTQLVLPQFFFFCLCVTKEWAKTNFCSRLECAFVKTEMKFSFVPWRPGTQTILQYCDIVIYTNDTQSLNGKICIPDGECFDKSAIYFSFTVPGALLLTLCFSFPFSFLKRKFWFLELLEAVSSACFISDVKYFQT